MKAFLHHLQNEAKLIISLTYCVDGEFALNEIARATLQQYGIVQLSSATNSDSETEAATNGLLAGYPQTEIESFYRQEKEALAWQADNSTETSMLTQIARNRGVPFEILVEKVIEKSAQFAVVIGIIIGQRQAFEDRLLTFKTPEELTALEQEIEQWQFPT